MKEENKMNRGKCLALVAVLAMIVCAFAVTMPTEESVADISGATEVSDISAQSFVAGTEYKLTAGQTINTEIDLKGATLYLNGNTVNVKSGTLTNGTIDLTNSTNMLWLTNGTISKITFQNYNMAICLPTSATNSDEANIVDCIFNSTASSNAAIYIDAVGQEVNISGCKFNDLENYNEAAIDGMVYNTKYSKVTIENSGTISIFMWSPNAGATNYELEFSSNSATTATVFDIDNATTISSLTVSEYNNETPSKVSFKKNTTIGQIEVVVGTVAKKTEITVDANVKLTADVVLAKDSSLKITENGTYSGTVSYTDDDEVKSTAYVNLTAGSGGNTIAAGSIDFSGAVADVNGNSIVIKSGNAVVSSTFSISDGMTLTVEGGATLTVEGGATLTINDGATLAATGGVTNNGTIVAKGTVSATDIGGNIKIVPGADQSWIADGANVSSTTTGEDSFGMSKDLESDYTVKTSAFLENDLTVPEGITLTVEGNLDLNGKKLTVYGTLNVTKKGQVQTIDGGTIVLGKTGTIINNGIIGYNSKVIVKDQQASPAEVRMKNVVGLSFALTKEVESGDVVYKLTVSGEAAKKGADNVLEIAKAYISDLEIKDFTAASVDGTVLKDGSLTIASKATVTAIDVTLKSAITFIDGTVSGGNVHLCNGSIAYVNGKVDTVVFEAKTGEYATYDANGKRQDPEGMGILSGESNVVLSQITGVILEVTSKAMGTTTPKTEQMLNVYGTPSFNKNGAIFYTSGTITVTGNVYVPAETELVLADGITAAYGAAGKYTVLGTISAIGTISNYVGASFSVKTTVETRTVTTNYYTTFDVAYAMIDLAVDGEITLMGGYSFSKEYAIEADQEVRFGDAGKYTIAKTGKITVFADGTLSGGFVVADALTDVAAGIQGILVVMDGGDCKPATGSYEVSSKDAEGNMTYSGAAVAIENATAGSTIYITNPVSFSDKTTIPAGVTVDIAAGASITADKGLIVNGKIVNKGTINVGELEVAGEIDNTGGNAISVTKAAVTGKVTGDFASTTNVSAATYYADGQSVYSSLSAALTAVAAMDVPVNVTVLGTVKENASVTLVDGMKLTIDVNAALTTGTIRLVAGSSLEVDGTITADIVGEVGKTGAVSDATVSVTALKDAMFALSFNESTTTSTMTMTLPSAYTGSVAVQTGEVSLYASNDDLTFSETKTLSVASDATLVLNKPNGTLDGANASKKHFVIDGTLSVNKDSTLKNIKLGGKTIVAVEVELKLTTVTVVGEVVLSEKEGKTPASVKVDGMIYIGTNPGTLGASGVLKGTVNLNSGYAIVFVGSTFESKDSEVKYTKYTINDIEFATVYGTGTIGVINDDVVKLANIASEKKADGTYNFSWKSGSTSVSNTDAIGKYTAVTSKIDYTGMDFTVSVGPGIIVYIDDLRVNTTTVNLTIGTHKITTYIQPSYTGTVSISLNGEAVTGGEFKVTTDMLYNTSNMIVLTGASPVEPVDPVTPDKKDNTLTDILLIVLVVLIAVMAIMVALRMMRS